MTKQEISKEIGLKNEIKPEEVEELVNNYLDFTMDEIRGKSRKRKLADARAGVCVLFWIAGMSKMRAEERAGLRHGVFYNYLDRIKNDIETDKDYVIGYMRVIAFFHNPENRNKCYPRKFEIDVN